MCLSFTHELIITDTFAKVLETKCFRPACTSGVQQQESEALPASLFLTHHVDLQVNGEANVVGYIVLPHIHNVVHLVGNLPGGPFLIHAQAASAQSAARSGAKQPPYLSAHLRRLGCEGQPRSTGGTRQQESVTGEERTGNVS